MHRMNSNLFLKVAVFIMMLALGSDASFFDNFRKLGGHDPKLESHEISPASGPTSVGVDKSGNGSHEIVHKPAPVAAPESASRIGDDCSISSKRCSDKNHLTACLLKSPNAPKEVFLLVKNDGGSPLTVNLTTLPANITFQELYISKYQIEKVNISANIGGSTSIVLNAVNGPCLIYLGSPIPRNNIFKQFPSYAVNITPIYGAYLVFLTALVIGGVWACCKWGKGDRRVDGIPYQELEMGQPESLSANNVETAEGWDQGWDDDWDDEIREVKSPNGHHVDKTSSNGHFSRTSDKDGWGNDWDD